MKKAIFFDLDGTLWDALSQLTEARNKAMIDNKKHYRFTLDSMKSFMGLTPEETVKIAFNDVSLEEGMSLFKLCFDEEIKYLVENPGVKYPYENEIIESLSKKYDLYIVSNADKGYIEDYLIGCNMNQYFKDHLCAGDTLKDKWENILIMKEKHSIVDVIYVGDTLKDKIQSTKAGVKFIHAAYGFGVIEDDEYKIDTLKELPSLVEKVFNLN